GWARGGNPRPAAPPVDAAARERRGTYYIAKDDVNQSRVLIGGLAGQKNDPDFYALTVMSSVLGRSYASRLFNHVRSHHGLAYEVSADWDAGWDHPGAFIASGATKSETTVKMLLSIRSEIEMLAASGATEDEVSLAKDAILKSFAFDYDSVGKVV